MTTRKTAIAVPEELLRDVDVAAAARGESRSRFINHVLRVAVCARRDAEITSRLDEIFAVEATRVVVVGEAKALDEGGHGWDDERW